MARLRTRFELNGESFFTDTYITEEQFSDPAIRHDMERRVALEVAQLLLRKVQPKSKWFTEAEDRRNGVGRVD